MKSAAKVIVAIVGLFALVFVFFFAKALFDPQKEERMRARDTIEACWKEQGRQSLGKAEKRLVAGSCERLEKSFEQRFQTRP